MSETQDNSFRGMSYKNLAGMAQAPASIKMEIAAAGHGDVVQAITEEQAAAVLASMSTQRPASQSAITSAVEIKRGQIMLHKPTGHKVTIIQAFAAKSGSEKLHTVIDNKTGKRFQAKQSNLK